MLQEVNFYYCDDRIKFTILSSHITDMQLALVILSAITIGLAFIASGVADDDVSSHSSVTITPKQYCFGCQALTSVYAKELSEEMKRMNKEGVPSGASVDATHIAQNLCNSTFFGGYEDFIRHSCLKIIGESLIQFLKKFEGSGNSNFVYQKGSLYRKTEDICVDLSACQLQSFQSHGKAISEKMSTCDSCHVVISELENLRFVRKEKNIARLLNEVCDFVSYSNPYSVLLESLCEELVDDFSGTPIYLRSLPNVYNNRFNTTINSGSISIVFFARPCKEKWYAADCLSS